MLVESSFGLPQASLFRFQFYRNASACADVEYVRMLLRSRMDRNFTGTVSIDKKTLRMSAAVAIKGSHIITANAIVSDIAAVVALVTAKASCVASGAQSKWNGTSPTR
jgi:hypothetical protein